MGDASAPGGYLLAGGQGRRFGGDKLRAELVGRPVAVWAVDALLAVAGKERVKVVGPEPRHLAWLRLTPLADAVPAGGGPGPWGPLAGVVAAVEDGGGWVLAADMPAVPPALLRALADRGRERPACAWALGRPQPLAGWWPQGAAAPLRRALDGGERQVGRAFTLAGGRTYTLAELKVEGVGEAQLLSVNRPEDLALLTRVLARRGTGGARG